MHAEGQDKVKGVKFFLQFFLLSLSDTYLRGKNKERLSENTVAVYMLEYCLLLIGNIDGKNLSRKCETGHVSTYLKIEKTFLGIHFNSNICQDPLLIQSRE